MKKILLMIVFILTLFLGPTTISGNDVPGDSLGEVTGISDVDGMEYTQDLTITFTEESATLNGNPFISGTTVNEIGNYELILFEGGVEVDTIAFVILPRLNTPLMDENVLYQTYDLNLENVGTMLLNGEIIENYTDIEFVGDHVLTIEGVNGYTKSYSITIKDQLIEFLKNSPIYSDFTIDISKYAEVYYEDELLTEDLTFEAVGYYTLDFVYFDETEETIELTYGHATSRFENYGVYSDSLLIQKGTAQKWYLDGVEQKQGIDSLFITKVGRHTVIFVGEGGYQKNYTVTVTEGDIGISDGDVFEDYFEFDFTGFAVQLNDVRYTSGSKKSGAGFYTMKVKGVNGYVSTYEIFITEEVPFKDVENFDDIQVLEESLTLNQDFDKIFVNGKEVENYRFSKTGVYRIVYQGAGGYLDAYTVEYINHHSSVNNILFQGVMGLAGLVVLTYAFLAWRRFK